MLFQLVQIEVAPGGGAVATTPTRPLFELAQDAAAMAGFAAARTGGDYGCDAEGDCWWAVRADGHVVLFMVRPMSEDTFRAAA